MKIAAAFLTVLTGALAVVIGTVQGIERTVGGTGGAPSAEALAEIPPHLLAVYQQAAATCEGLPWQVLAAIGWMESRHGGGSIDPDTGQTAPPILGPVLDGSGRWKPHTPPRPFDARRLGPSDRTHAVPLHHVPSLGHPRPRPARSHEPDPHNAWDAIFTAARYLCGGNSAITDLRAAIFRYNHSQAYVSAVLDTATRYGLGATNATIGELLLATIRGITVNARIADQTAALLAAAENDGIRLTGGGYRSHQQQITLRRAHCGQTPYDIYQRPAGQSHPPTARPGQSFHEQGLAIDFTCDGHLIVSRQNRCFLWLDANAHRYGFTGISSEAWHWEVRAR